MDSGLDGGDKMKLVDVFAEIPDGLLMDIAKLLEKDPSWIVKLNDNKKKKEQALATGDMELWNQILEEEKQYMHSTGYDLD